MVSPTAPLPRPPSAAQVSPGAAIARAIARSRSASKTTPGRMRILSVLVIAAVFLAGVATVSSLHRRGSALHGVRTGSEPLLVIAQQLRTDLTAADAAAANAFLAGGIEPAAQRQRYTDSIASAGRVLSVAARQGADTATARDALALIGGQLPVYTGLVDTARANNRQGFPIGAAYLRKASALMAAEILPAADRLFQVNSERLDSQQAAASSPSLTAAPVLFLLLALGGLAITQVFLLRKTRRLLNVGAVLASVLVLVAGAWSIGALSTQASGANRARERGYRSVAALAQTRILAYKAKGDESLSLVARGNGAAFEKDLGNILTRLGTTDAMGPLADAVRLADSPAERAQLESVASLLSAWVVVHQKVAGLDAKGQFDDAVALAVGTGAGSSNEAFDHLDAALRAALDANQAQFTQLAKSSADALDGLSPIVAIAFLMAALTALWGVQQRIAEYR